MAEHINLEEREWSNIRIKVRTKYLTIISRTRVGYELLDSGRGAKHQVSYHKLISNKREWNNCFIKYQTLDKNIFELYFLPTRVFGHFVEKFSVIKC